MPKGRLEFTEANSSPRDEGMVPVIPSWARFWFRTDLRFPKWKQEEIVGLSRYTERNQATVESRQSHIPRVATGLQPVSDWDQSASSLKLFLFQPFRSLRYGWKFSPHSGHGISVSLETDFFCSNVDPDVLATSLIMVAAITDRYLKTAFIAISRFSTRTTSSLIDFPATPSVLNTCCWIIMSPMPASSTSRITSTAYSKNYCTSTIASETEQSLRTNLSKFLLISHKYF